MATPIRPRRTHTPLISSEQGSQAAALLEGLVWAASDEFGWVKGKVVSAPSGDYNPNSVVDISLVPRKHSQDAAGRRVSVTLGDLLPVSELDDDTGSIGDVLQLQVLHDAAVFETLRLRYFDDKIYTQAGPTSLISINPYKQIPQLYTQRAINLYKDSTEGSPPHVFGMSQNAYNNLVEYGVCQSILCSGESGAGKTEVAKLVVQYLAATTSKEANMKGGGSKVNPLFQTRQVQNQIIESNPLLEAFGNAKTVRNENSSRFGKFIQILFSSDYTICGGRVRHYLLEKARVVSQHPGERNYHVFYQMCAGLAEDLRKRLHLTKPQDYNYLNRSGVYELLDTDGNPLCDEVAEFNRVEQSMTQMRIERELQAQVWQVLAAILHLGNIEFETVDKKSEGEGSRVRNPDVLNRVAALIDCDPQVLETGLTYTMMKVTGESNPIKVPQNAEESGAARDALSKVIYEKLFAWLVSCINTCLSESDALSQLVESERKRIEGRFIGVLDIFGFEVFEQNSFEQLCINYANETLQQQFINQMLHSMMAQYQAEGVTVAAIPFEDNSPCVDLLESKMGILALLDDECNFPKGSDEDFLHKLMDRHRGHSHLKRGGSSSDPYLKEGAAAAGGGGKLAASSARVQSARECFVISHFAGEVEYSVAGFLDKNRDTINESLKAVLKAVQQPLLSAVLGERDPASLAGDDDGGGEAAAGARTVGARRVGGASRAAAGRSRAVSAVAQRQADKRSLGFQFKQQLLELVKLIESGKAHYVRCVKPNNLRKAHNFDASNVVRQLRCSGVTETVRARRAGWPVNYSFHEFVQRYSDAYMHWSGDRRRPKDALPMLQFFLVDPDNWRIGTSKVFVKDKAGQLLEERYKVFRMICKLILQGHAKMVLQRIRYGRMSGSAVAIQKTFRMWSAVQHRRRKLEAVRVLQTHCRCAALRVRMVRRRLAAQRLQARLRSAVRWVVQRAKRRGAARLQAALRRRLAAARYGQLLAGIIAREREEMARAREETARRQLAEEERVRAEQAAANREGALREGDGAVERAHQSVERGDVPGARRLLAAAREAYARAGGAVDQRAAGLARLEETIEKADQYSALRAEGDGYLKAADQAVRAGHVKQARTALSSARSCYDRAAAVDMADSVAAVSQAIEKLENREKYSQQGDACLSEARAYLARSELDKAAEALQEARAAFVRGGVAELREDVLGDVRRALDARRAEAEAAQREAAREREEKEAQAARDSAAAEEAAAAMKARLRQQEEAAQMQKMSLEREKDSMLDRVAVDIGGYGAKLDPQTPKRHFDAPDFPDPGTSTPLRGAAGAESFNGRHRAEEATPTGGRPVALEPDARLEVLKEGWLLKQSKKLKKWQKRYFVLDNVALYYCRSPTSVPDGFFAIRRCQFHYSEKTCCFDVITPSRVFRMQTPDGVGQLREWAECYKQAMAQRDFPYFHVEQTTRVDLSRELLLGVMSTGLRMVKLGLYDPGFEEEIAIYTFDEIYSWGATDLQTFEFRVASERMPYSFKTMHAQEIEAKLENKFARWREWRQHQTRAAHGARGGAAAGSAGSPYAAGSPAAAGYYATPSSALRR